MIDAVLKKRSLAFRVSVKSAVSVLLIVLAAALPQIAHYFGGASAGAKFLPMYAPALMAGCLLSWQWGLGVGVLSPLVSFGFTTLAFGEAMPAASRLPYMILELGVFGLASGLFAKKIQKNVLFSFPAVAIAQISGRAVYLIYNLIAGRDFITLLSSVEAGLAGLYIQLIVVPLVVILLAKALVRDKREDE